MNNQEPIERAGKRVNEQKLHKLSIKSSETDAIELAPLRINTDFSQNSDPKNFDNNEITTPSESAKSLSRKPKKSSLKSPVTNSQSSPTTPGSQQTVQDYKTEEISKSTKSLIRNVKKSSSRSIADDRQRSPVYRGSQNEVYESKSESIAGSSKSLLRKKKRSSSRSIADDEPNSPLFSGTQQIIEGSKLSEKDILTSSQVELNSPAESSTKAARRRRRKKSSRSVIIEQLDNSQIEKELEEIFAILKSLNQMEIKSEVVELNNMLEPYKPRNISFVIKESEELNYFYPAHRKPNDFLIEKIRLIQNTRQLESEGLYLEKSQPIPWQNLLTLETRLKVCNELKYFIEDSLRFQIYYQYATPMRLNYLLSFDDQVCQETQVFDGLMVYKTFPLRQEMLFHDGYYQLFFRLGHLRLTDHYLMIEETRKEKELEELIDEHTERTRANILGSIHEKIKEQRSLLLTLLDELDNNHEKQMNLKFLLEEIQDLRSEYEEELKFVRNLEWTILKLWEELKEVRKLQNFTSTPLKVAIEKIFTQIEDEEAFIDDYYQESCEEKEIMVQLEHLFSTGKKSRKSLVSVDGLSMTPIESKREIDTSQDLIDKKLKKMKKLIQKNMRTAFRPPGTSNFKFETSHSLQLTSKEELPEAEKSRRNLIENTLVYCKLIINKKQVLKTSPQSFNHSNFELDFTESDLSIACLQIHEYPCEIYLEIWEIGSSGEIQLGKFFLDIKNLLPKPVEFEWKKFELKGNEFQYSTVYDTFIKNQSEKDLNMTKEYRASVQLSLYWDYDEQGRFLGPPEAITNRENIIVENSENHTIRNQKQPAIDDLFIEKVPLSKRNEILKMRNENKLQIKQPLPLSEKDITQEIIEVKEQFLEELSPQLTITDPNASLPPTITTNLDFLKRIRSHPLYKMIEKKQLKPQLDLNDFVKEEKPVEEVEGNILLDLITPIRPLRPERKQRTHQPTSSPSECFIMAQVIRGMNIPIRTPDSGILDGKENKRKSKDLMTVRSYVEVQFQNNKDRTGVIEGPNPQWNESFRLPVKSPNNDFKPEVMKNMRDLIYFNIYDEFVVESVNNDKDKEMKIHVTKEKNWLGTLAIPFSALYEQTVLEGKFHVQMPSILLDYEKDDCDYEAIGIQTDETMLHLFITLEPALTQLKPLRPPFESEEDSYLLKWGQKWKQINKVPISPTAIDLNGKTFFLSRYIFPQEPPSDLDSVEKITRFVSLIPFFEDSSALNADIELWSTSQQFLNIEAGDMAEHAILLCNYFLYFNMKASVLLGRGIPEGKAAYVLVEEEANRYLSDGFGQQYRPNNRNYYIFHPLTGLRYKASDVHCPLTEVYAIFNDQNIWANVQQNKEPGQIEFDLSHTAHWKPLFTSRHTYQPGTIQEPTLKYTPIDQNALKDLETTIYQLLIACFEKWRDGVLMKWNRSCSRLFESILPLLEKHKQGSWQLNPYRDFQELKKLQNLYRIRGFPLNLTFTDYDDLVEAVLNTDIHSIQFPNVEFALGVYCHGYYNGAISVWIYIASLTRLNK